MHTTSHTGKEERINLRASPSEKSLIAIAARLSKIKPTQFVRQAILEKAQQVVMEANNFILPEAKWQEFITALDEAPREIPRLKKLLSKKTLFE